ncbi:MAG TPA: immunoglobulin domain-containing protein [Verrucomicrobiae bacterium]|jgi:hypothetical protein|nr:immunoglobulin domain-containing protein [Verrucomicrobiae bacterium]
MKKCISRGIVLTAIAGLALAAQAQDTNTDQSQFPTIFQQPVDQCVPVGSAVTFSVVASNADSYQWYDNNTALDGQTNSSLTIPSTGTGDVGYYYASVIKGSEAVPTRSACLNVYTTSSPASTSTISSGPRMKSMSMNMAMSTDLTGGGVITVFGAPVVSGGGGTGCPGAYSGYVNFTKPMSEGWGFAPDTSNSHTATDSNRSDTKVQFNGYYGDGNCAQTTVTVGNPPPSPAYRFTIFFPRGSQVPTNSYAITLVGFNP